MPAPREVHTGRGAERLRFDNSTARIHSYRHPNENDTWGRGAYGRSTRWVRPDRISFVDKDEVALLDKVRENMRRFH